jgi:hypothetical protein
MTDPTALPISCEWDLFHQLLPAEALNNLDSKAAQTVYTPFVIIWLLIYQRLHGNGTLNDAVSELTQRFPVSALPDCKRAREGTISANSGAYSKARNLLDKSVLRWATDNVYNTLIPSYPPSWKGRRAFVIDGTTLQLAPKDALRAAFPPASNQYGPCPWPILHLAVAHELASGLAIFPEFGPKYGPEALSELALSRCLLKRLPTGSILLGDRNFGVFAFAWSAQQMGHDVLLRLTKPRFKAMCKKARRVGPGKWELTWHPSGWDRKSHPELPLEAEVCGWLHEVRVSEKLTLWMFETLAQSGEVMAALYRQRIDVETDIKDVKITLKLDILSGQSVDMIEKELAAGMLAYNLTNQVRRVAAARLQIAPRRLSFAGIWSLLKSFMAGVLEDKTVAEVEAEFERLLRGAGQRKLPNRPKARSYPRETIPKRRKFPGPKRTPKVVLV